MTIEKLQSDIENQIFQMPHSTGIEHAVCGLCEEAGEVAGLLKRECYKAQAVPRDRWVDELGDVLWYLVATATVKGISLEEIIKFNKQKLEDRYGPFR